MRLLELAAASVERVRCQANTTATSQLCGICIACFPIAWLALLEPSKLPAVRLVDHATCHATAPALQCIV